MINCDPVLLNPTGLGSGVRVFDDSVDALLRHLLRELHDGGADDARLDVGHARAAAVDGADGDLVGQAGRLDGLVAAGRCRLIDRVERVAPRERAAAGSPSRPAPWSGHRWCSPCRGSPGCRWSAPSR